MYWRRSAIKINIFTLGNNPFCKNNSSWYWENILMLDYTKHLINYITRSFLDICWRVIRTPCSETRKDLIIYWTRPVQWGKSTFLTQTLCMNELRLFILRAIFLVSIYENKKQLLLFYFLKLREIFVQKFFLRV